MISKCRSARWLVAVALVLVLVSGGTARAQPAAPSAPSYEMALSEAWIPMPDGVRLAADLYMPSGGAAGETFPVLLEYLPYRKGEARARSHALYGYFVERGYVVARVDIRGTGNSEGRLIAYEYTDQEQEDGEVVIDWLAKQPWSTGAVGMFGISWGGFNSIHMAMRNPPALKAIIAVDATDDLYQDDVHYMDGILHLDSWEMSQDLDNARPGPPDYSIDDDNFRNRFDTEPWMMTYKRQQRDGPFWERTALKTRYESIRVPSFLIGGWYDGYRDSVPRMLEHLKAPVKAILGPWSHALPNNAYPKPQFEWRNEAVRWFDYWLKGRDTGILDEPRFAVFIRDWHPPGPYLEEVPGRWRWEDGWPVARVREEAFYPQANHTLARTASNQAVHRLRYVPWVGMEAGGPVMWWGDVAHDQRPTDAYSLVYDSDPLDAPMEILGLPRAQLRVSADARHANWFVRVSDVAPDGTVTQVAGAGFNGTHRDSAKSPSWLVPDEVFPLEIEMHFTSWVFPAGHRVRVSLSNAQWPMFWPSPYPTTTTLDIGGESGARVLLPVVPAEASPRPGPSFLPVTGETPRLPGYERIDDGTSSGYGEVSTFDRDPQTGVVRVVATNTGATRFPWGIERYRESITHQTEEDHPEKTSMVGEHRITLELEGRTLVWEAELDFRSDLTNFFYTYTRRLLENGVLLREKVWNDTIPRDFQ